MKCPYCKKELNKLVRRILWLTSYDAYIQDEITGKVLRMNLAPVQTVAKNQDYVCPSCGRMLAQNNEQARDILLEDGK